MIIRYSIIITVFLLIAASSYKALAIEAKTLPEGFLWYNEKPISKKEGQEEQNARAADKSNQKQVNEWDRRLDNLKQAIEQAERKAMDNPTLSNVMDAQRLHKHLVNKADKFATMWQLAALIDHKLVNIEEPSNSMQKKLQEEKMESLHANKLKRIAKQWGLVLQFDAGCQVSHAFAPIVKEFATNYGFQVLAVSQTGKDFLGITGTVDTGFLVGSGLNPEQVVPVLYLISGSGEKIYPISRGISSPAKIVENIMMIDKNYQRLVR